MKRLLPHFSVDWTILVPLAFISIFGLTMLLSTAPPLFYRQLISFAIGIIIIITVSQMNPDMLRLIGIPGYIISIVLISLLFIFADPTRGSYRWFDLGSFRVQPSEIAKPLLIVSFAQVLTSFPPKNLRNLCMTLTIFSVPFLLIFKEPDLGSAVVVATIFFGMLFMSGIKMRYLVVVTALITVAIPVVWQFTHQYQRERVLAFLNPQHDPLGKSYNINQSVIAVGSGQLYGRGLGHGTQTQLRFLPEHSTDFIFAGLAEELGFIGTLILLGLYLVLFWRILHVYERIPDRFFALIVIGAGVAIITQVFIHIGGNIGIMPVTGITLPFVSYGGSSVIALSTLVGAVIAIEKTYQRSYR